jgi:hypothetical protein
MAITVRPANLELDHPVMAAVMSKNLPRRTDEVIFNWLYGQKMPHEPRAWIATDSQADIIAGLAAAFPRRFYIPQTQVIAWVLGDFCLSTQYRSLGPALQLQRACLGMDDGSFCYDFPSPSMVAVYKRLGFSVTGRMLRLAMLLRVDKKIRGIVKCNMGHRAVSSVGNAVLRGLTAMRSADHGLEISVHAGRCGEEFTILDRKQRGRLGICAERSAEYLNWRYVDNPFVRHEFLTARRNGALKGYAVWTQDRNNASIVDLFGENDPVMVKGLLSEIIDILVDREAVTLSVSLNDGHPWLFWFSQMGFRVRDSAPWIVIPSPSFANAFGLRNKNWFLMQGDRDS